ncbi:MAG: Asp-tRNA(Asn)/Glu-tRNA(Gln) amidotransferase subunit GatC [Candidatus Omnitrophica bacterium]|nr:Asp-tRNA(Asn)/Glu-tRNA(Gln) amidotransferase subunit GatC [Candidatus Omnitrophota bacterium]
MEISPKEVEYLAQLCRLELTPEELKLFAPQIKEILSYVEILKSAPTHNTPPTTHVLSLANVYREDQIRPSLDTEKALANAPAREGPFFKVPKVIDAS